MIDIEGHSQNGCKTAKIPELLGLDPSSPHAEQQFLFPRTRSLYFRTDKPFYWRDMRHTTSRYNQHRQPFPSLSLACISGDQIPQTIFSSDGTSLKDKPAKLQTNKIPMLKFDIGLRICWKNGSEPFLCHIAIQRKQLPPYPKISQREFPYHPEQLGILPDFFI